MDKNPVQLSAQQLVIGTLTVVLSFLWYMSGFLTLREHNEFVARFNSDIARLEAFEITQNSVLLSKREFEGWKNERDRLISIIEDRLNNHDKRISDIERDHGKLNGQMK